MARAKRHFLPGHAWHLTHQIKEASEFGQKAARFMEDEDEYQLRDGQAAYGGWQDLNNENTFDWNLAN